MFRSLILRALGATLLIAPLFSAPSARAAPYCFWDSVSGAICSSAPQEVAVLCPFCDPPTLYGPYGPYRPLTPPVAAQPKSEPWRKLDMSGADGSLRACYVNGGMAQQMNDLSYVCSYEPIIVKPAPRITSPEEEVPFWLPRYATTPPHPIP